MNGKIGSRSFLQRCRLHDSRPCSGADPRCFPFGPAGTYRMSRRLAILPICTVLSTNRLPSLIRAVGKGTLPAASASGAPGNPQGLLPSQQMAGAVPVISLPAGCADAPPTVCAASRGSFPPVRDLFSALLFGYARSRRGSARPGTYDSL